MATAGTLGSVDAMRQVLSYLVTERQQLRSHGAAKIELEANRKAIVAIQWQLSRALGEQGVSAVPPVAGT